MNDIAHKQMLQDIVKARFRGHKRLLCKAHTQYPIQAEREYQRVTNAYMRLLNQTLKAHLPEIKRALEIEQNSSIRQDDISDFFGWLADIFHTMAAELERKLFRFGFYNKVQSMAHLTRKLSIREWKRAVKSTIGIDLLDDYYSGELFRDLMQQWVNDNVALIKTIPQQSLTKMREIVLEGYRNGETTTSIMRKIRKTYGISRRHAQLIARDQIAKLNSNIAQQQQRDAGVTEYIWSTSGDSRVRESHRKLNGKRFRWDDPPIVDEKTKRRCHPGEDYQCRCVALAVFDFDTLDLPIAAQGGDRA